MESKQRNQILTVLFIGVLMGALDIAIVGPALPAIRNQFSGIRAGAQLDVLNLRFIQFNRYAINVEAF